MQPDVLDETDETFNLNLSGASGATIADSQGMATIVDNDPPPSVVINDIVVTEGSTGTTTATFTLTLSAASGRSLSVGFITAQRNGNFAGGLHGAVWNRDLRRRGRDSDRRHHGRQRHHRRTEPDVRREPQDAHQRDDRRQPGRLHDFE